MKQEDATSFVTVGNTGSYQPQLQQPTKSHILQDQYITGLENRLRVLWDKYYGDLNYYMERIKRLEDAGDEAIHEAAHGREHDALEIWRKAKEAKP